MREQISRIFIEEKGEGLGMDGPSKKRLDSGVSMVMSWSVHPGIKRSRPSGPTSPPAHSLCLSILPKAVLSSFPDPSLG